MKLVSFLKSCKRIATKYGHHITLTLIELVLFFKVALPFWLFNNLYIWDLGGQYGQVLFQKMYLFPKIIGWNPFFFGGYPQNQFYPPLATYVTGLISFITGIPSAIKIVIIATVMLTPISFYYLNRKIGLSKVNSSISTLTMMFLMFAINPHMGGGFHSLFIIGLNVQSLAIVLLFFYMGVLIDCIKKDRWIFASVMFASIILTHIITSVFAALFFAAAFIVFNKKFLLFLKHGIMSLLLVAFWVFPFLAKLDYLTPIAIPPPPIFSVYNYFFVFSVIVLICSIKTKNKGFALIPIFYIINYIVMKGGYWIFGAPFHYYRLGFMVLILVPVLLMIIVQLSGNRKFFSRNIALAIISIIFLFITITHLADNPIDIKGVEGLNSQLAIPLVNGRVHVAINRESQPGMHLLSSFIPLKTGNLGTATLFAESSPNARYYLNLRINPAHKPLVWGGYDDQDIVAKYGLNIETVKNQLNTLGINYLFTSFKYVETNRNDIKKKFIILDNELVKKYPKAYQNIDYYLYKVSNTSIIEALEYYPPVVEHLISEEGKNWSWSEYTVDKFFSDGLEKVIVYTNEELPKVKADNTTIVNVLRKSQMYDSWDLFVNSTHDVPILIKITHFPNWKVYVDGSPTKVYRVSPYFMLFYGKGDIKIRYEQILADKAGYWLSIFGVILLIILIRKNLKQIEKLC